MDRVHLASEEASHAMRQQITLFQFSTSNWMSIQRTKKKERYLRSLIDALSDFDYTATPSNARRRRHKGTGKWLFDLPETQAWFAQDDSKSALLWLHGIPGSGKTILTTAIIDELLSCPKLRSTNTFIGYYFVDHANRQSLQIHNVLRTLVKQLLTTFFDRVTPELAGQLPRFVQGHPEYRGIFCADEWLQLLKAACLIPKHLYICIDGLDECSEEDQYSLIKYLQQLAVGGGDSTSQTIRIFIASRPHVPISALLPPSSSQIQFFQVSLSTHGIHRPEIESYIKETISERLSQGRLSLRRESMKAEITTALLQGAEGMFLWIYFQIEDICAKNNDEDIRATLASLPRGLDETYSRILDKILSSPYKEPNIAMKVFRWVAGAQQPLTLDEIAEAVALSPADKQWTCVESRLPTSSRKVIENCAHLIILNDDETVQFAHSTVLEFLSTSKLMLPRYGLFHINIAENHRILTELCIAYLRFPEISRTVVSTEPITQREDQVRVQIPGRGPVSWIPIMKAYGKASSDGTIEQLSTIAASSIQLKLKSLSKEVKGPSALPFARPDLKSEGNVPESQRRIFVLLQYIIANCVYHFVMFLCHSPDLETFWQSHGSRRWIQLFQDPNVREHLRPDASFSLDQQLLHSNDPYYFIYQWAIQANNLSVEQHIRNRMIGDDVQIRLPDGTFFSPESQCIMGLPSRTQQQNMLAFVVAIARGYEKTVDMLLEKLAGPLDAPMHGNISNFPVNTQHPSSNADALLRTVLLHVSLECGVTDAALRLVTRALVASKCTASCPYGKLAAWHIAFMNGNLATAMELYRSDYKARYPDSKLCEVPFPYKRVPKSDNFAPVTKHNKLDQDHRQWMRKAFAVAALQGNEAAIFRLLNTKAMRAQEGNGPGECIIQFSKIPGYNIFQDHPEMAPDALELASQNGNPNVVKLLITAGALPTSKSIFNAVKHNNLQVLNLLMSNAKRHWCHVLLGDRHHIAHDLHIQEGSYTALWIACFRGYAEVVELILKITKDCHECLPATKFKLYGTPGSVDTLNSTLSPLEVAIRESHNSIAERLFSVSYEIVVSNDHHSRRSNNTTTAVSLAPEGVILLHSAIRRRLTYLILFILQRHPAAVTAVDSLGRTVLSVAAEHGCHEETELLLSAGADCNKAGTSNNERGDDINPKLPLHLACYYGNVNVVKVLLEAGAVCNALVSCPFLGKGKLFTASDIVEHKLLNLDSTQRTGQARAVYEKLRLMLRAVGGLPFRRLPPQDIALHSDESIWAIAFNRR
ncbi:hypothetical protein BDZ91DRAFT_851712 [Kalaharituber pfeilii]|nr:hypothetical protein BDZ91DRAFT_851712 [Kalaharituber pfeilii]